MDFSDRELHLAFRPTNLSSVVGQDAACLQLTTLAKSSGGIPHCMLFTGPSGCGKTTLARIVRTKLKCGDSDFCEINAANNRGVDMVRDIQTKIGLAAIEGPCRVWLIDECHQLTSDAQGAFLKLLEEPPAHVYFFLATTDPQKLKPTIRTRCTEIAVRSLGHMELISLVNRVASETTQVSAAVATKIADVADGSARKALVCLQQVAGLPDEPALKALDKMDAQKTAIEIARAIQAKKSWKEVAGLVSACDEDPESIRRMMLAYFSKVALGGQTSAVDVLQAFRDPYYDTGKAGLVISCYEALNR